MAGKIIVGKITRKPAEKFVRDGKTFVRFFGVDGIDRETEVFGPAEFEAERGMTFKDFCEKFIDVDEVKSCE